MQVPLLDLHPQYDALKDELESAVLEVLRSTRYINGPKVDELERAIADYTGARFALGVSSGTDALLVALMALGVGPGDAVVTTPYSFFATVGCITRLGAKPILVDILSGSYNMDPKQLSAALKSHAGETVKAIMPIHLYGQCADMQTIRDIARSFDIPIVEDAAQAIGAKAQIDGSTQHAGTIGAFGCFSFFPSKNLGGVGDGGMITTNDETLFERIKTLRAHGASPKYYHAVVGGNFRLDAIQAAALLVKLPRLDSWHKQRQEHATYYDEHLQLPQIKTPIITFDRASHVYNQYVVAAENRDALQEHLRSNGVGCEIYYPVPFHLQEALKHLGHKQGDFPVSERAARETLAIPIYPDLTQKMQDHVIESIKAFYA